MMGGVEGDCTVQGSDAQLFSCLPDVINYHNEDLFYLKRKLIKKILQVLLIRLFTFFKEKKPGSMTL